MTIIYGRKLSQTIVAQDTDQVVSAMPIPKGGALVGVNIDMRIIASNTLLFSRVCLYGVAGFIVPVLDPDASQSFNEAWDTMVPKDRPTGSSLDLDTGATSTGPEFEIGEHDINKLFDMTTLEPREFFSRRKLLSYADDQARESSTVVTTWTPRDAFQTHAKGARVNTYSYALLGFSAPNTNSTRTTI